MWMKIIDIRYWIQLQQQYALQNVFWQTTARSLNCKIWKHSIRAVFRQKLMPNTLLRQWRHVKVYAIFKRDKVLPNKKAVVCQCIKYEFYWETCGKMQTHNTQHINITTMKCLSATCKSQWLATYMPMFNKCSEYKSRYHQIKDKCMNQQRKPSGDVCCTFTKSAPHCKQWNTKIQSSSTPTFQAQRSIKTRHTQFF